MFITYDRWLHVSISVNDLKCNLEINVNVY